MSLKYNSFNLLYEEDDQINDEDVQDDETDNETDSDETPDKDEETADEDGESEESDSRGLGAESQIKLETVLYQMIYLGGADSLQKEVIIANGKPVKTMVSDKGFSKEIKILKSQIAEIQKIGSYGKFLDLARNSTVMNNPKKADYLIFKNNINTVNTILENWQSKKYDVEDFWYLGLVAGVKNLTESSAEKVKDGISQNDKEMGSLTENLEKSVKSNNEKEIAAFCAKIREYYSQDKFETSEEEEKEYQEQKAEEADDIPEETDLEDGGLDSEESDSNDETTDEENP